MEFMSMDLIGRFEPPSTKGNCYALTAIDMLTGFVWCIPIPDKKAITICNHYLAEICTFGGATKILTDNGTEFKNELFCQVAKDLGVKYKKYTAPYHPSSNGRIEGFHNFLKAATTKYVTRELEWDQVCHLATQGYNYFPGEHAKESPFFLMFGWDPCLPLDNILSPRLRYVISGEDNDQVQLSLSTMRKIYALAAYNILWAREKKPQVMVKTPRVYKEGDLIIIKNHTKGQWDTRYLPNWRIVSVKGKTLTVRNPEGKERSIHQSDCQLQTAYDVVISNLPTDADFQAAGRAVTLEYTPNKLTNLDWTLPI
jgi:hypothetical protein